MRSIWIQPWIQHMKHMNTAPVRTRSDLPGVGDNNGPNVEHQPYYSMRRSIKKAVVKWFGLLLAPADDAALCIVLQTADPAGGVWDGSKRRLGPHQGPTARVHFMAGGPSGAQWRKSAAVDGGLLVGDRAIAKAPPAWPRGRQSRGGSPAAAATCPAPRPCCSPQ